MKLKRNSVFIIAVSTIIIMFSVSFIRNFDNSSYSEQQLNPLFIEESESDLVTEEETNMIVVDIKGAVNRPGVYEMKQGDRVINLIEKANGFHEEANKDVMNLALVLEDEMAIFVPFQSIDVENNTSETIVPVIRVDDGKININKATVEELQSIPGIGPAKANALVSYREEKGLFKQVEDIVRVSGIGERTLESIKDFIKVK